jgi:hypothetical protein
MRSDFGTVILDSYPGLLIICRDFCNLECRSEVEIRYMP